jgi:hypothetical protein
MANTRFQREPAQDLRDSTFLEAKTYLLLWPEAGERGLFTKFEISLFAIGRMGEQRSGLTFFLAHNNHLQRRQTILKIGIGRTR